MNIYFDKPPTDFIRQNLEVSKGTLLNVSLNISHDEPVNVCETADLKFSIKQTLRDALLAEFLAHGNIDSNGSMSLTSEQVFSIFDKEDL